MLNSRSFVKIASVAWLQCCSYVYDQLLHMYVVTLFSILKKVRNTSCSALILFLVTQIDFEVFKMVSFAIVVTSISRKSVLLFSFCKHFDEFRAVYATWNIQCVVSRRATIAIQTILETSESCRLIKKESERYE